jgi:hypothetical protein
MASVERVEAASALNIRIDDVYCRILELQNDLKRAKGGTVEEERIISSLSTERLMLADLAARRTTPAASLSTSTRHGKHKAVRVISRLRLRAVSPSLV